MLEWRSLSIRWNIRVEPEVVFLRLSLLWGFSEDVLHLDNYLMLFCFLRTDIFVFFTRYSLRYVIKFFIHQINCYCYCLYSTKCIAFAFAQNQSNRPSKANNGHRPLSKAIWIGSEKLNNSDFKLLSYGTLLGSKLNVLTFCNMNILTVLLLAITF